MEPEPNPELVAELAGILRGAAHPAAGGAASGGIAAEWSQIATAHAGRIYTGGSRYPLPAGAEALFRRLHEDMRDETRGAWFSARMELHPDAAAPGGFSRPEFTVNYTERVYWNGETMLTPAQGVAPIPSDAEWSAELRRNPRAPEFLPEWISARPDVSSEFGALRSALEKAGLPRGAARLPGEEHVTFEGALLVRELSGGYSIDIFDYGQLHHLATEPDARSAGLHAWNYLSSPLPDPVSLSPTEVDHRVHAAAAGYSELGARIQAAGAGGIATNLAVGVPFDRWGGIDGFYLFAWQTPVPQRSLPPSAAVDGAARVGFIAAHPVPVQAEFAPAWFDQPGGGIRFRTHEPLRDLVRAGALRVITVG